MGMQCNTYVFFGAQLDGKWIRQNLDMDRLYSEDYQSDTLRVFDFSGEGSKGDQIFIVLEESLIMIDGYSDSMSATLSNVYFEMFEQELIRFSSLNEVFFPLEAIGPPAWKVVVSWG